MPLRGYDPKPENYLILECKTCGTLIKVLRAQRRTMTVRCRNCHGTRFRTWKEP